MKDLILNKAEEYFPYMVEVRRHLHRNPEVSFHEFETTEFIYKELEKMGLKPQRPLETGCVALIEGEGRGKTVALRADIDALAMDEVGDAKEEFISMKPGAAHCCGHDAHTANLLGTAKILCDLKEKINGRVVLIFQPAEEKLPGGGRMITESGILQKYGVEEIYGLHTSPELEPGRIALKSGAFMACTVEFEVEMIGRGGHAAAPHQSVDPVLMAAQVVSAFQSVVSRSLNPVEPAVLTVGKIEGGSAHNIIPEKVKLLGTVRAFSMEIAREIKERMEEICKGIAISSGGSYSFRFDEGYPAVVNDEQCTGKLMKVAEAILGREKVHRMKHPLMAGEDFAFYQQQFPGSFFFLGSGSDEADSKWSWHHPRYNVDERAMITGSSLMAGLILGDESLTRHESEG